jgi:hypothetical protein
MPSNTLRSRLAPRTLALGAGLVVGTASVAAHAVVSQWTLIDRAGDAVSISSGPAAAGQPSRSLYKVTTTGHVVSYDSSANIWQDLANPPAGAFLVRPMPDGGIWVLANGGRIFSWHPFNQSDPTPHEFFPSRGYCATTIADVGEASGNPDLFVTGCQTTADKGVYRWNWSTSQFEDTGGAGTQVSGWNYAAPKGRELFVLNSSSQIWGYNFTNAVYFLTAGAAKWLDVSSSDPAPSSVGFAEVLGGPGAAYLYKYNEWANNWPQFATAPTLVFLVQIAGGFAIDNEKFIFKLVTP